MMLSIVTTLYQSASYLQEFYERVSAVATLFTPDYELILVNDGSPDNSLDIAVNLHRADSHVRVVDLSRNFGHHKAIMTGLAHARGSLTFLLDCDLEEEPELLIPLHEEMQRTKADVIYGVQSQRKGGWFERLSGAIFYKTFNLFSEYPLPQNMVTARLMTSRYVRALVAHQERELLIGGLWVMTGFHQVPLTVHKQSRKVTSYTLAKRISIFVNFITSFTSQPLKFIFYMGALISTIAALAAAYLVIRILFFGSMLSGWPSLIISIWLLGGLILFSLGVLGIYLAKIFNEVKQRPYVIIRDIYEQNGHD